VIWEKGHKPRIQIQGRFEDIVLPLRPKLQHNVPLLEWSF